MYVCAIYTDTIDKLGKISTDHRHNVHTHVPPVIKLHILCVKRKSNKVGILSVTFSTLNKLGREITYVRTYIRTTHTEDEECKRPFNSKGSIKKI